MVLEYAIISQIDTSGAVFAPKASQKPQTEFTKDELSAILKYGAQNMFKADDNQLNKQLDELDLDEILKRAEDHETIGGEGGSSLGGEGFLQQLATVSDVKADLSWDEIIPLEERERVAEEEAAREQEEATAAANQNRKRAAAQMQPGAYQGMDVTEPPAPSNTKKAKGPAPPRKTAAQRSMELKERDLRVLIRSLQKWGDIRLRYDDICREAKLEDKNHAFIIETVDQIIETCERAMINHREAKARAQSDGNVPQKSKAVLVDFRSVSNINAETVVSRHRELKILNEHIARHGDAMTWSLPVENIRPTLNWSCRWGPQDDAMLLVGAWKHGFGNWEKIQEDPELGLGDKFFLDEGKKTDEVSGGTKPIPNAIHLVRRGDYLLGVLREYDEKMKSFHSALRHKRDHNKHSASPAPSGSTKRRASPSSSAGDDAPRKKRRPTPTFTDSESSDDCPSMDETATKEELRPVKKHLKQLKAPTDDLSREEKVALLKESLSAIGARIDAVVANKSAQGQNGEKWRKHLWVFVTYFWPREVRHSKLQAIHAKITDADAAAAKLELIRSQAMTQAINAPLNMTHKVGLGGGRAGAGSGGGANGNGAGAGGGSSTGLRPNSGGSSRHGR
jgi:chromodomain-helicase-DNA-binding protein 1